MKIFNRISEYFSFTDYGNNILKVFSGTAVASIISIALLPILTRLYSVEMVGYFQLFISTSIILSTVLAFKYDLAIVLPKKDNESNSVTILAIALISINSLILYILLKVFNTQIFAFLNATEVADIYPLIIIGAAAIALVEIFFNVFIRQQKFNIIAKGRVLIVLVTFLLPIVLSIFGEKVLFLIWGVIAGNIVFVLSTKRFIHFHVALAKIKSLKLVLLKYKKFPLINMPSVLVNSISLELPVFMLSKYGSVENIGLYLLANRLSVLPINYLSVSVAKVYYQKASELFNKNPSELKFVYLKTIKKLALIGLLPYSLLVIISPLLIRYIFGPEWEVSAQIIQILAIGLYMRMITSPVSSTFTIMNKQEFSLILIVLSFILRFTAMYWFRESTVNMFWALSISTAVFYLLFNLTIYYMVNKLAVHHEGK